MAREEPPSLDLQRGTVYPAPAVPLGCKAGRGQMWPPSLGRAQVGPRDRLRGKCHPLVLALGWKEAEHPDWRARGRCLEPVKQVRKAPQAGLQPVQRPHG